MADNYLEKKMEALQERKSKEQRARQIAWKKRMDAYKKRLEEEKNKEVSITLLETKEGGN
jgi:hypothetical protein